MKLRSAIATLVLLPVLLAGCQDDPSGPKDEIYSLATVQVGGNNLTLPAVLFSGPLPCGRPAPCNIRYEARRGTLLLLQNGRYEFSAQYRISTAGGEFPTFDEGAFEDGTFTVNGNAVTFKATNTNAPEGQYLASTGTRQNGELSVGIEDPIFENLNTYSFRK